MQALNRLKKSNFHVVPFQKQKNVFSIRTKNYSGVENLFGGESNPGLQRDRLGYSPLYYTVQFRAYLPSSCHMNISSYRMTQ